MVACKSWMSTSSKQTGWTRLSVPVHWEDATGVTSLERGVEANDAVERRACALFFLASLDEIHRQAGHLFTLDLEFPDHELAGNLIALPPHAGEADPGRVVVERVALGPFIFAHLELATFFCRDLEVPVLLAERNRDTALDQGSFQFVTAVGDHPTVADEVSFGAERVEVGGGSGAGRRLDELALLEPFDGGLLGDVQIFLGFLALRGGVPRRNLRKPPSEGQQ